MTSVIVPPVDLAPGMPSRVVTISATDVTEGGKSLEGQMVRFALSDTLDVSSGGDVIAKTQAEVVLDANGEGSIRLPVYDEDVKTWCGQDWAVLVTATWGSQKAIRVPAGTSSIALSALPPVRPLRGREKQWAITGVSVSVKEGSQWSASVGLNGGILDFDFTVPPGGTAWSLGWVGNDSLNGVRTPGTYSQHLSAPATVANGYPGEGMTGVLEVIPTYTGGVMQRYTRNTSPFEVYTRTIVGTTPGPWVMLPSPIPAQILPDTHLDTLITAKTYFQNLPAYATTDRGYPENGIPGVLEVIRAHHASPWALQRYTENVQDQPPGRFWLRTVAPRPTAWVQYAPGGGGGEVDMAEVDQRIHALAQPRTTWQDDVQGLYERTDYSSFTALAADPRKPDRVWGRTSQIGYSDSNGTGPITFVGAVPADAGQAMMFTDTHVFYVAGIGSRVGTVWRSPLPDLAAPSLTWTKVFDLADQSGGDGSYFREQSLAISPSGEALVLEYGGVVTGGPSVYHCPDIYATTPTWVKAKTWAQAKHGHGVVWLNGRWWVMNGDANFPDAGLWTSSDGTTWERATPAWDSATNRRYGINIHAVNVGGMDLILTDSDTREYESVLYWPTTAWDGKQRMLREIVTVPPPYNLGTVRSLTLTSEGNLMWMQIGENGSLGPTDSLWISRGPQFTNAVLLEEWPSPHPLGTLGSPVESGDYVFFGRARVRKEKFIGQ